MIFILTVLSGGTGTPKLLQGLIEVVPQEEISVIVNTGEDVHVSGLRVSPDLDTVVYTLAGLIDDQKWYGIEEDTFHTHDMLKDLGHEEILRIGDRDRSVKLYRTFRMREGATLSQVTKEICTGLGVQSKVLPMSDDRVTTRVFTDKGEMTFHKYWVERGAEDEVRDVKFMNHESADPAPGVLESLNDSESIIIGPSNPITSVGPILAIDEIRSALERNREKVIAISPVLGDAPVSGPTGDLMRGLGHEVSPTGVANIYKDFVGLFMLNEGDEDFATEIKDLGMEVSLADILIPDLSSRISLVEEILEVIDHNY